MHAGYFPDTTLKLIAARKATVLVNRDEHGFYASCPELKHCQSPGLTLEEVMANIREAAELYLDTLPDIANR
jgi:predicted RNase H-like HicB family nuclease